MDDTRIKEKPEMVEISKARLEYFFHCEETLNALEAAGVDNWEGYDYAMELLNG